MSGKANKAAMSNFHQSTNAIWAHGQSEDATGDAPTVITQDYTVSEAADLSVVSNASEEGAMKIECLIFLVWSANIGHFGYLLMYHIYQEIARYTKFLILSRERTVQKYKETVKKKSSISRRKHLSFRKPKQGIIE